MPNDYEILDTPTKSLSEQINDFARAVGDTCQEIKESIGELTSLHTSSKENVVAAINSLYDLTNNCPKLIQALNEALESLQGNQTSYAEDLSDAREGIVNLLNMLTNFHDQFDEFVAKYNASITPSEDGSDEPSPDTFWSSQKTSDEIEKATDTLKEDLLGGADEAYDTLKEIQEFLQANDNLLEALKTVSEGHVDYTKAQNLNDTQKSQARTNIEAAKASELASLSVRVQNLQETVNEIKETGIPGTGNPDPSEPIVADSVDVDHVMTPNKVDNYLELLAFYMLPGEPAPEMVAVYPGDKYLDNAPYGSYALQAREDEEEVTQVKLLCTSLRKHVNTEGKQGYWVSFGINPIAGATQQSTTGESGPFTQAERITYTYDATAEGTIEDKDIDIWYKVSKARDEEETVKKSYHVSFDINTVECKDMAITEEMFDKANIVDQAHPEVSPYGSYAVTKSLQDNVMTATYTITDLKSHDSIGHGTKPWVGFAVMAPGGMDMVSVNGNTPEKLEKKVVGDSDGIAVYFPVSGTDVSSKVSLDKQVQVQFLDTTFKHSVPALTVKCLGNVSLYEEPFQKKDVALAKILDTENPKPYEEMSASFAVQDNKITAIVTGKNLQKHKNAQEQEGYWCGIAIAIPSDGYDRVFLNGYGMDVEPVVLNERSGFAYYFNLTQEIDNKQYEIQFQSSDHTRYTKKVTVNVTFNVTLAEGE